MYNVLNLSKTGLKSMQTKMDAVADELANSNTNGYKKKEISFRELLTNETFDNEVIMSPNVNSANINMGSRSDIGTINFQQGTIIPSSRQFDMAISGNGFFGVRDENENLMLTRNGSFHIDNNQMISDANGYPLDIELIVGIEEWDFQNLNINASGEISKVSQEETVVLGNVVLYTPEVLNSLTSLGENRYMPSANVQLFNSIDHNEEFGDIIQYALEGSNVDITKTMADMITTQRAYSLNSRAIQTTDDIMSMINGIKQ